MINFTAKHLTLFVFLTAISFTTKGGHDITKWASFSDTNFQFLNWEKDNATPNSPLLPDRVDSVLQVQKATAPVIIDGKGLAKGSIGHF